MMPPSSASSTAASAPISRKSSKPCYKMKDRKTIGILALSALLLAVPAGAQEAHPLSLKEAIDRSVQNSKALQAGAARIAGAQAAVREAQDRRLPDASVSASYLRLNKPNVNLKTKPASGGTGAQESASPNAAAYAMANVSVPLFAGYRIKYGIESAKYLEQAVKLDAQEDREAVVANAIEAWNNLFKARAAVALVDSNLAAARERVRELANQERAGIIPRNDLLKAQLAQSNTELALLDARNNWELANVNMNILF
ncbi:MAG: hypothetical protein EOO11_10030 [Chitinophagaceae bacterium]|nr:MAG: hypothetical protein EOO11_10030 [Chitinophagaceae bacterium]